MQEVILQLWEPKADILKWLSQNIIGLFDMHEGGKKWRSSFDLTWLSIFISTDEWFWFLSCLKVITKKKDIKIDMDVVTDKKVALIIISHIYVSGHQLLYSVEAKKTKQNPLHSKNIKK